LRSRLGDDFAERASWLLREEAIPAFVDGNRLLMMTYFCIILFLAAIVHFLPLMVFVIGKKETTRRAARDWGGGDAKCNFCLSLGFILTT
jgi:hypothetical protein